MENANHWYFTKEQLENTPSRKCGIEASKELSYRQQAANFIQDMGQKLQVTQLCINTAIVYMHRFYMFHSFSKLHRNTTAVAALFLAAKVEEQPRKLEHVVRVAHKCLHRGDLDPKSDQFLTKCSELVLNENIMLQTLGFEIGIDHPHTYVVKLLQLVKASKDLAQTSYIMATNSLHLTTMCLQYKPTVVASVCIHLACKWSNWKIEPCSEGKEWYYYVDKAVTPELLEELTKDFLAVLEKSPNRLKRRVGPENNKDGQSTSSSISKPGEEALGRFDPLSFENQIEIRRDHSPGPSTSAALALPKEMEKLATETVSNTTLVAEPVVSHGSPIKKIKAETPQPISLAVYREKREKERLSEQRPPPVSAHPEMPSSAVPVKAVTTAIADKHHHHHHHHHSLTQEKRPVKPNIASSELVPHKSSEKVNTKHGIVTSHAETTSRDKVNHLLSKPPSASSVPVVRNAVTVKVEPPATKSFPVPAKGTDPFVLLTRVDQAPVVKKSAVEAKPSVDPTMVSHILKSTVSAPTLDERQAIEARLKTEHAPSLNMGEQKKASAPKAAAVVPEAHEMVQATKHVKHRSAPSSSLHNSHTDVLAIPQVNQEKPVAHWDSTKSNGSGVISEPPQQPVPEVRHHHHPVPPPPVKDTKPVSSDRVAETHNKHEKREKHKHRHAGHSGKDRTSNHVSATPPVGETHVPAGSIKITIPKDKLVLSGMHQDNNQKLNASATKEESPRTSLKIKIAKVKPTPENSPTVGIKPNSSGSGLKLVITKDKNAGSYSASHKAERASRKRQRSPSSKEHNSSSSGKSSKIHAGDQVHRAQLDGLGNNSVIDGPMFVPMNPAHRSGEVVAQTNAASAKQTSVDMYHHQNNIASQQYMMPYNTQPPYYNHYFQYAVHPGNMQYSPMQPPPMPPHVGKAPPPLPREPPPPLPPQPPLPSE